ncbi:helix-turn-helix transcriptional regulator [Nocardiopsis sp. RSe5-2]|uniref:Helix-turn-helix transcriptional regulator n=1 Tax=Nocardiopsis endophytica TaxID=3018445 RepID=A0ABT4UC21_9ACTN|nr:helix-turn-helix transcriptional regulator [Nocardiopsis endophytica]MDA2814009.1 helix-turn-helix transcriptional regulator [Nocardiopsis endophytica]
MTATTEPFGELLRRWRTHRRRTQMDVALAADVSTRHLSCLETGRSAPSPEMVERLCEELEVPLRERNALHLAAGFAPAHAERPFTDLGAAADAVRSVLDGQVPNPAVAVNVHWDLLAANPMMAAFLADVPPDVAEPRLNMLRATLHPRGLAPRIRNLAQWRAHVLRRVRRQLDRTAAPGLADLLAELSAYPAPAGASAADGAPEATAPGHLDDIAVPMRVATDHGDLALLYTTTVFGAARDVTLDEIAVETFYPADPATAKLLRALAGSGD